MKVLWKSWALGLFLLAWAGAAAGQQAPTLDEPVQPHPEGDAAIDRLRSPFCPGMMLEVCPSPQAKLLRDSLQMMAWEGAPSDSLVSWMLSSYGEEYRAVPQAAGSGLWAWLMPPLALLSGLILVALALQQLRSRQGAESAVVEALSSEDEEVLEEALKELKESEEIAF